MCTPSLSASQPVEKKNKLERIQRHHSKQDKNMSALSA
jgi:hypothetical protein